MFGVDEAIAGLAGGGPLVVVVVALLLGLRHAADPDHLVAVSALVASEPERRAKRATVLGLGWGAGHATTLLAFGLPVVLFHSYLPAWAQRSAEALVGIVIVALGLRLFLRWRSGRFHVHVHEHGDVVHRHLHAHETGGHGHAHVAIRSPGQAYGIGCIHGAGGSAAVAVLLLASLRSQVEAVGALVVFACATAGSMALISSGLGYVLGTPLIARSFQRLAPLLAAASLVFGGWYAVGAIV